MDITIHAQIRYVQRILGIEDEDEAKEYFRLNTKQIKLDLYNYLNNEDIFRENCIYDMQKGGKNIYYISNGIIFVFHSSFSKLITIYKVWDTDFNNKLDSHLKYIRFNNREIDKYNKQKDNNDCDTRALEEVIKVLENQLSEYKNKVETNISNSRELFVKIHDLKELNYNLFIRIKEKV